MRPRYGNSLTFQDGGRRHLGIFKFQIFNDRTAQEGQTASPCQIWSKSVKKRSRYGDFSIFQDGGRPPSWICYVCVRTTHEGHLVVFITVQNLVGIDGFDNMQVFRFHEFGLKMLIHAPKLGFWGILPLNGEQCQRNPKRHILARVRVV